MVIILRFLSNLFLVNIHGSSAHSISGQDMATHLNEIHKSLTPGVYQDAHEFLIFLLDLIGNISNKASTFMRRHLSFIEATTIQCDACKITRTQTKQNIILEIYFNANSTIGVPDMVNVVTTSKISDYHCHQCRVKGQATITERIFGNTSTLFVHITKTPTCNGSVRIENTHLTVNRRIYRLTGIVQYLSHGHYIAYIKSLKQPCLWFRVSDTQVEVVSSAKVLTIPPFILT
jgi:uncharacterized UBP type Zn finger protein